MITRDALAAGHLPRHECERLLMKVTGASRSEVVAGLSLDDDTAMAYSRLCRRRVAGEPLQYIEGSVPFGTAEIAVDKRVLIPRPETEYMWEKASLVSTKNPEIIVDLSTGSGALAVALSLTFPDAQVWATDISAEALEVAELNVMANEANVALFLGDLFAPLPDNLRGKVDLFVSNPPYISADEVLPSEVSEWEPRLALIAGDNGRAFLRRIADELKFWMAPSAWFFIEIGETQADVADWFGDPFHEVHVEADLAGRPRYVVGRRR